MLTDEERALLTNILVLRNEYSFSLYMFAFKLSMMFINNYIMYNQRLRDFGLPNLKLRRDHIDLVMYHKILHDKTRIRLTSLFELNARSARRSNCLAISKPICRTSAFLHSFPVRAISNWNKLSDNVIMLPASSFARTVASLS